MNHPLLSSGPQICRLQHLESPACSGGMEDRIGYIIWNYILPLEKHAQNVHEEHIRKFWTHNYPEGLWDLRSVPEWDAVIDLFGNLSIPIEMMLVAVAGLRCLFNPSPLWKNPWIICVTWLPAAPLAELAYFTIFPCQGELLVIGLLELGLDPWTFGFWWPDKMLQASCTDLPSHEMKSWGSLCELQCGLYFWRLWCWSLLVCIKLHHAFVKVWKVPGGRNCGSHWACVLTNGRNWLLHIIHLLSINCQWPSPWVICSAG